MSLVEAAEAAACWWGMFLFLEKPEAGKSGELSIDFHRLKLLNQITKKLECQEVHRFISVLRDEIVARFPESRVELNISRDYDLDRILIESAESSGLTYRDVYLRLPLKSCTLIEQVNGDFRVTAKLGHGSEQTVIYPTHYLIG